MGPDVLANAHRGQRGDLSRHPAGAIPPGLIGHLVHVAVVTGKITSAVNLDDKLTEWDGCPAFREQCRYVERRRPFKSGLCSHTRI
jgi:hypothetical protein